MYRYNCRYYSWNDRNNHFINWMVNVCLFSTLHYWKIYLKFWFPKRKRFIKCSAVSPVILVGLDRTITTVEGRHVSFICKVFGSPKPDVIWKSDPQLMGSENVNFEKTSVDADGVTHLKLLNVQRHHTGMYACAFRNIYNNSESQGRLEVKSKRKCTSFNV